MSDTHYDVIVIGAGSGGLTSAVGFSKVGKKVLLIEREHMGGECTNTGCVPSKALLHHAREYHRATQVAGEGVKSAAFRTDAFAYVRNIIDEILAEETPDVFEKIGIDVIMGEAEFVGTKTIKVADATYTFKTAIIATGSSPRMISVPGLNPADVLTNQNVFDLKSIPEKLLVIGSGPIGMELGQAFAMLGSHVTIASIDSEFARLEDPAIRPIVQRKFKELGIRIELNAHLSEVKNRVAIFDRKEGKVVTGSLSVQFDKVLVAIGRVPNLPNGLEVAGIQSEPYGIKVDSQYRTTNASVYALGDVSQRLKFTHTADNIARQVVTRVISKGLLKVRDNKAVPKVTYITPEVAQVGLSYTEALEHYGEENIFRIEAPFSANDRAKTEDTTDGIAIVIAKRLSGRVLGAHIAGPAAGEILSVFTLAIDQKISMWKLRNTIFAYPTYSLIIKKLGDYFFATQIAHLKTDLTHFVKKHALKVIVAALWAVGLYYLYMYQQAQNLSAFETAFVIFDFIALSAWGALIYIAAYTLRPLVFFPGTALTILSGVFFGFWVGTLLTIIAANISAAAAYGIGRFFGGDLKLEKTALGSWIQPLRDNPFESVLITRLIFLPFDLVSFAAGILKIKFIPFVLANFVGTLLGIATFVAVGASLDVEELRTGGISRGVIDLKFLGLSALIFVVSIILSKTLKRK